MTTKKRTITVITPCYNEQSNLKFFFKKFLNVKKKINKFNFNLVFVNDGSKDDTLKKIKTLSKKYRFIKYLSLTKNFGHQNAIYAGLVNYFSDYYIVMDSDLQHDPNIIHLMVKNILKKKVDIIQMKKLNSNYESKFKIFTSKLFYFLFSFITKIKIDSGSSDFYMISKRVRDQIVLSPFSKNFLRGFLHWSGFPKIYLTYNPKKRVFGKSSYNFFKQLDFGLTGFFNFQNNLFTKIFLLSLIIMLLCAGFIIFLFFDYFVLNNKGPDGWSTIIVILLFFGSITFFINSILIYLITLLINVIAKKPNYIINEKK